MGRSVPFAIDFGAVMGMGAALGCDLELLADTLPAMERAVIASMNDAMTQEGDDA